MKKLVLSRAAREDLERIDDYTLNTFGLTQAQKVLWVFEDTFEMLATFPESAPERPEFDPPGRRFRYRTVLLERSRGSFSVGGAMPTHRDPADPLPAGYAFTPAILYPASYACLARFCRVDSRTGRVGLPRLERLVSRLRPRA